MVKFQCRLTAEKDQIKSEQARKGASLREAARVFRESKISNEKSNFFLFYQNIPFCELVSKKKYFKVPAIFFPAEI